MKQGTVAPKKILVVEDDPEIRLGTVRLLAKNGYQVFEAENGARGLEAALAVRPDLVLSDVAMPELDGIELCRRVRANPELKSILFMFVSSAHTQSNEQADGLDVGADGYIARPISNRELLSRVSALIRIVEANTRVNEIAVLAAQRERLARQVLENPNDPTGIKESQASLDLALLSAQMGAWRWDIVTDQRHFDDRGCRLLGLDPATFHGTNAEFLAAVHPDDREKVKAHSAQAREHDTRCAQEYRVVWPDGSIHQISSRGGLTLDPADRPLRIDGIIWDITERKRAEEEKDRLQARLAQAQKMESVGLLAGGIAHDFNNMLGVILGHSELALDQLAPNQPIRANLEYVYQAARRSADITRQLLAYARKQTIAPRVLDLNTTVAGAFTTLRQFLGKDIDLTWRPGAGLWSVKVDPTQIEQILTSLCANAKQAISGIGTVTIESGNRVLNESDCTTHTDFSPGDYVHLSVTDTGCGMDQKTQTHIFEPFFTTKGLGKSMGLGLATVFGAIKQNRGAIEFHSELGQGTTFTIYLPRYADEAVRMETERKG